MIAKTVRTAAGTQQITMAAIEQAAFDLREFCRADLNEKLDEVIGNGTSISETEFIEEEFIRWAGVYADDADWDDPDLEPIGYEPVPMLVIRATRQFVDGTTTAEPISSTMPRGGDEL